MLSLEQQQIIDRYKNPLFRGDVAGATHTSSGQNLSCGDEVTWQARVVDGVVEELKHRCTACAVCSASADILAEEFSGKAFNLIQNHTNDEVVETLGVPLSPIRRKCAVLPLEALKNLSPNL